MAIQLVIVVVVVLEYGTYIYLMGKKVVVAGSQVLRSQVQSPLMILFANHFQDINEKIDHVVVQGHGTKDIILFAHLVFRVLATEKKWRESKQQKRECETMLNRNKNLLLLTKQNLRHNQPCMVRQIGTKETSTGGTVPKVTVRHESMRQDTNQF